MGVKGQNLLSIAINPNHRGQNQNLRPLINSNRGIVTIVKWSQNLVKQSETDVLSILGPKKLNHPFLIFYVVRIKI